MALLYAPRLWANSDSLFDLINRFSNYANSLGEVSNGQQQLTILGIGRVADGGQEFSNSDYLKLVIYKKSLVGRVKLLLRLVNSFSKERTVIAGDPYLSFWTLWVMKRFFFRKVKIQISVHGLPLGLFDLKGFNLRLFALRSSSRRADSIRVVSNHLGNLLQNSWGVSPDKVFIAPVPVQFAPTLDVRPRQKRILIVGRLHEERGVLLAIEIALRVLIADTEACLVVIGDGPLKSMVESCVIQSEVGSRVSLVGRLSHSEVLDHMGQSLVLLTAAPEEGFGLAIREAAYSGSSVVALRNSGTIEAENELAPILSLFSTSDEGFNACRQALDSRLPKSVVERARNNAKALNEDSLRKLALSWI
jgi:glycosyltransferase involved in cell wall biosynthesis